MEAYEIIITKIDPVCLYRSRLAAEAFGNRILRMGFVVLLRFTTKLCLSVVVDVDVDE